MKIAVYTICKNEQQFVQRWLDSCKDADYIIVADTGSTDETVQNLVYQPEPILSKIRVHRCSITPWRFDDARNFNLAVIPEDVDVCICLDMDEILTEGWRDVIEKTFSDYPRTTRLRYNYIWSWNLDGTPGLTYHADKIHVRKGYRWVNPVHEVLTRDLRLNPEVETFINNTLIEHYPDLSKPRGQYLPLLELGVRENPNDDRMAHYYARELFFNQRYHEALREFERHLALPTATWKSERAASYRYMGDCYWALGAQLLCENSFISSLQEENTREGWVKLAQFYRAIGDREKCIISCEEALKFQTRPNTYINDAPAWSDWPEIMLKEAKEKLK